MIKLSENSAETLKLNSDFLRKNSQSLRRYYIYTFIIWQWHANKYTYQYLALLIITVCRQNKFTITVALEIVLTKTIHKQLQENTDFSQFSYHK